MDYLTSSLNKLGIPMPESTTPITGLEKVLFDLAPSKKSDSSFIAALKIVFQKIDHPELARVILTPASRVDGQHHLRGCTYVIGGNYPCEKIFTAHDLLAATSMYALGNRTLQVDTFLDPQVWATISDYSRDSNEEINPEDVRAFPRHNGSIGLYTVRENTHSHSSYIIERAYNQTAVESLREYAKDKTVSQVYHSHEYTAAVKKCADTRNSIAASVVGMLGININELQTTNKPKPKSKKITKQSNVSELTYLEPIVTNRYNFLSTSDSMNGYFCFYDHTYNLKEDHRLLYGISRISGYIYYGWSDKDKREMSKIEQDSRYEHTFPIGAPLGQKEEHYKHPPQELTRAKEITLWGNADVVYNAKIHDAIVHKNFHTTSEWSAFLRTINYDRARGEQILFPEALYLSSEDGSKVSLENIIKHNGNAQYIKVSISNNEINRLERYYNFYKEHGHKSARFQDLWEEHDNYYNVNVKMFKTIKEFVEKQIALNKK